MISFFLVKLISLLIRKLRLGSGFTWPGEIALFFRQRFIEEQSRRLDQGTLLVSGTNGKTTTSQALSSLLENCGGRVVVNPSGANLLNGVASAFVSEMNLFGQVRSDVGVFEIDEATLAKALPVLKPKILVLLNLFRDQLDRYGEVDYLVSLWQAALDRIDYPLTVFINANDPALASLKSHGEMKLIFFGLADPRFSLSARPHHADSFFCLNCGGPLSYDALFFSHLGTWSCRRCGRRMPFLDYGAREVNLTKEGLNFTLSGNVVESQLSGLYNVYNLTAVFAVGRFLGVRTETILKTLREFRPHFGRQESFSIKGRRVKILLSKNPTGFNENLRFISEIFAEGDRLLLLLNDGIADGRDVSWIYDVDFENFPALFRSEVFVGGRRAPDLALRLKYAEIKNAAVDLDFKKIIWRSLEATPVGSTLYALPTYTAMLESREILLGRRMN